MKFKFKKKIYEAREKIINVFWIYVILMAMAITVRVGIAKPVLGVGALVIAVIINIMLHIGGGDDDSGRNET